MTGYGDANDYCYVKGLREGREYYNKAVRVGRPADAYDSTSVCNKGHRPLIPRTWYMVMTAIMRADCEFINLSAACPFSTLHVWVSRAG